MIARPIVQSLLETLESFEQLKIQSVPQLHQGKRFISIYQSIKGSLLTSKNYGTINYCSI